MFINTPKIRHPVSPDTNPHYRPRLSLNSGSPVPTTSSETFPLSPSNTLPPTLPCTLVLGLLVVIKSLLVSLFVNTYDDSSLRISPFSFYCF